MVSGGLERAIVAELWGVGGRGTARLGRIYEMEFRMRLDAISILLILLSADCRTWDS